MKALIHWLDDRTGIRSLMHKALLEPIPGGARWRYVWGSTLVFTFLIQVLTGFCLWASYSPSVQHAWASVFYVEEFMPLGSLVRGMHHYTAQFMVVLMVIHFLQVVIGKAYSAPREFNFWIGLILMMIVLGLGLTGYLLPWDQKGYYATQVATKILGATPQIGESLQLLVQGGPEYGQHTLTRFFALHAGILPTLMVLFLVIHIALFRRHGITVPDTTRQDRMGVFWPDQVLRDALVCLLVLGGILLLAWYRPAELSAPADAAEPFAAARPEWYFLGLFRFLKFEFIESMGLAVGAIIIPGIALGFLVLMPLIARIPGGHRFNLGFTSILVVALAGLTALAWVEDQNDASHQQALRAGGRDAHRARELARRDSRVPVEGAQVLLQRDPFTQGPRLFARHCASCHHFHGHNGLGEIVMTLDPETGKLAPALPTAADLGDLGTRDWMRAVLTDFSTLFAPIKHAEWYGKLDGLDPDDSDMADWSEDHESLTSPENAENLAAVIEFLVSETGRKDLETDEQLVERGREVALDGNWSGAIEGASCLNCHAALGEPFDPNRDGGDAPDIAGYLSADWLRDFIARPDAELHYGDRNQMPAYREILTDEELELIVRWLVNER